MPASGTAVIWFRRDLRLNDNPALAAAARHERVVPVFCFERGLWDGRHSSPNRNAYLLASLAELDDGLTRAGAPLHYRRGSPERMIRELAAETGATVVHVNRDHTAHARARDRRVASGLEEIGVELVGHDGVSCANIAAIETDSGGPYRVFTPFYESWRRAGRRARAPRPRSLDAPGGLSTGRPPPEEEMGVDDRAKRIAQAMWPGEKASRRRMNAAVDRAGEYKTLRDDAGADATSRLSTALHFGTISARELELMLLEHGSKGAGELRRQLCWRDFWLNVIRHFPDNREREFDSRRREMRWRSSEAELGDWKEGRTGVPWIDAGMRQLREEGWMHNRLRMAVASYLTKNLLIDWREGEAHFMRHLLDGDEAQNNGNWQWSASVGADAAPYFRIFNPVRQQRRFDPDGIYVRRWVPELAALPDRHLPAPWEAPSEVLDEAGITLGADYPEPLVDLRESRAEAIARFELPDE